MKFLSTTQYLLLILSSSCLMITTVSTIESTDSQQPNPTISKSNQNKLKQPSSKTSLIVINEDDWDQMLQGEWMVEL